MGDESGSSEVGGRAAKAPLVPGWATRLGALISLLVFFGWELVVFERVVGDRGLLSPATVFARIEAEGTAAQWATAWPAAAVVMLAIAGLVVVMVATLHAIRALAGGGEES